MDNIIIRMTEQPQQGKPHGAGNTYRISELVAVSGVSRDMIKYYLRANLLPKAHKPQPNFALYSENHLELIRLIQRFQQQTKLSLPEIAAVFNAAGHDANSIELELLSGKYRVGNSDNIIPLQPEAENTGALTFPQEFLDLLVHASLLPRSDKLGENEEQLAGLLWAARNAGLPLEFFQTAREKLAELADLEVKTLVAIKRPGLNFNAMVESVTGVDRIINRWMIKQKNCQIRDQFQRVMDNSERAITSLHDTIYQPSPIFSERYSVAAMLSQMSTMVEANTGTLQQSHDLCIACLLLAAYGRAIDIAKATLAAVPGDDISNAVIALAYCMQNSVDRACEYGAQLEHAEASHPVILQARMLVLLQQSAQLGGIADTSELMKSAGEQFLELPTRPSVDQPETILVLARANVAFPDFANSRPQATEALQTLLQRAEDNTLALPDFPIKGLRETIRVIYLIHTLYFLGELHDAGGDDTRARQCFAQVIQLDPSSNFGERAFLKLGQATQ